MTPARFSELARTPNREQTHRYLPPMSRIVFDERHKTPELRLGEEDPFLSVEILFF